MDILETNTKALDLYAEEMKRRVDQLEKTNKEKDETIKKHKALERLYEVAIFILVMIDVFLIIGNLPMPR
jgi:hypothetical protein